MKVVILLMYGLVEIYCVPIKKEINAMLHLQKFGYLDESTNYRSGGGITEENVISALKEFQRFAGLKQTGELDSDTIKVINEPRCGVKDKIGHGTRARKKRYAHQGSKWRNAELTYGISKYPSRLKNRDVINREVARAFKVWGDVADIKFRKKNRGRVNIDIRFEEGEHGDGNDFDGPNKTLAHAFAPSFGGDMHFDDDETWTINEHYGSNVFQIAAHEFGHTLGLEHSDNIKALMYPRYFNYDPFFKLHEDDISSIQSLYGPSGSKNPADPKKETTNIPLRPTPGQSHRGPPKNSSLVDLCKDATIDTITRTKDGKTYVFKGDYYWEIDIGIVDGYPRRISGNWGNMEGNLDASITWKDGTTFFFKGDNYWKFINQKMQPYYPKQISVGFEGIPSHLDAAFVWSGNGKSYFFKGDKYWKYESDKDPPVSSTYPRPLKNWLGLPSDIDAAFQWEDAKTYFFKGTRYYSFNDVEFAVEKDNPPYPRSSSIWWFNCE